MTPDILETRAGREMFLRLMTQFSYGDLCRQVMILDKLLTEAGAIGKDFEERTCFAIAHMKLHLEKTRHENQRTN